MPGMNGIQLAEEIQRTHPDIPVVLTSGYSSTLAEEGSHGFKLIQKPYSVDALSRVLRDAIGGRGPYKKTTEISN
jgi:DNA-binding NtrC family response regulator